MNEASTCAIAEECGGCALIQLPYEEQLEDKRERTAEACGGYPELAQLVIGETVPSAAHLGYRTRAKLACGRVDGVLRVGLYKPGTHDITDTPDCPVLDPLARATAAAVRTVFGAAPYDALDLRYISVRVSRVNQRAHLTFVLPEDTPLADEAARLLVSALPALAGVTLNVNPGPPLRVFGPTFRHLVGDARLDEAVGERAMSLGPGAFFQANVAQADAVVSLIREHFGGAATGRVVDFYAGAGALALGVAAPEAQLYLVEGYDEAARDARAALDRHGYASGEVVPGAAEQVAADVVAKVGKARFVIVNPPRKGCAPAVLQALVALSPERAAYVSCDPTTLARDLALLARLGYRAREVVPVDMLPQTDHIEAVALLEPTPAGEGVRVPVLFEDEALLVVDKPAHVAVHPGTGTTLTLLDLLVRDRGPEAARYHLVHRLDQETSGVIVLAKDKETARAMGAAFDERTVGKRYVCLVRGLTRDKGVMNRPLPGRAGEPPQDARTRYRALLRLRGHTLTAVTPDTGRLHQIRRHMADLAHPVIGDTRYGDAPTNRHFAERYAVSRLLLHAAALSFPHPTTKARIRVSAPLPGDFAEVLRRLGLERPLDTRALLRGLDDEERPASAQPQRDVRNPRAVQRQEPVVRQAPRGGGRWVLERTPQASAPREQPKTGGAVPNAGGKAATPKRTDRSRPWRSPKPRKK